MDTEIPKYGYRDPRIWIQRSQNMDTEIPKYGYRNPGIWQKRSENMGTPRI